MWGGEGGDIMKAWGKVFILLVCLTEKKRLLGAWICFVLFHRISKGAYYKFFALELRGIEFTAEAPALSRSGIIAFQTKKSNLERDLRKETDIKCVAKGNRKIPHTLFESISLFIISESFKAIA